MNLIKLLGWVGTFSYLAAYFLLSIKKIKSENPLYHILNIIGAIGLIFNAFYLNDYPNVAVNAVWALIAFGVILGIRIKKQD